jgi:pimeloyl-ACP methyl ester carboxylesterase
MRSLLLLSGLLCDETIWGDAPQRLADLADVRIAFFRGFSSIVAMAEHVLRIAPDQFALAGHSMGGRVALEIVRRAPERVTGIALLNTGIHPAKPEESHSRGMLVRLAQSQGMAALAQEWLPPMMGAPPSRVAAIMPRLIDMVQRSTPDEFAAQVDALLRRPDAKAVLSTIKVPTLLLSGTNDNWSSLAQHEAMQRHIEHAVLVEVGAAGHMAPVEQPKAVARALQRWLATI